ncbi:hypothetical protein [Streptomyces sp. SID3343]
MTRARQAHRDARGSPLDAEDTVTARVVVTDRAREQATTPA